MWAASSDRRTALGLTALVVVGAVAGFLAADPAAGREYTTVETIGDDAEAYAVDLPEQTRVRFVLEADGTSTPGGEQAPEAAFSVYDPADEHFASFDLSGEGDQATLLADRPGAWVVFVTQAEDAALEVQVEGEDNSSAENVRGLDVQEERYEIASGDGGPAKADMALRLERRPARAFLDPSGAAEDLDASVASEEGVVHAFRNVEADQDGALVNGSQRFQAENLAAGTYEVQAQAGSLNGTLDLVTQTYEREQVPVREAESPEDGTPSPPDEAGTTVAELAEHEAALVQPQGSDTMALEVANESSAKVYVYNGSDALVHVAKLEHDEHEDDARSQTVLELAGDGGHAVYVAHGHGHHDGEPLVTVRLPDVADASPASNLSLEEGEVEVEGENGTATFNTTGGLAKIGARSHGWSWDEGDVTVEGPRGVVLESGEDDSSWDRWWGHGYETYPERFGAGTFQVTVEDGGGSLFGDDTTKVRYAYLVE